MADTHKGLGVGQAQDPVCGVVIAALSATGTSDDEGEPYFFCSVTCKLKFDADPGRYLQRAGPT